MEEIYLERVIEQIPRLLGLIDRNPLSKTYGCFDRQYWHYHTSDFACARSQEAVLTLAILYITKNKKNPYYQKPLILEWINAGIEFWTKIQTNKGSFNEWYPNENSYVATAFSTYAISETIIILDCLKTKKIIHTINKANGFLIKNSETRAQNQESGAIMSLLNVYKITNNKKYLNFAEKKLKVLLKKQTKEGWWDEYGGADIGYLSLMTDYLAKYYKKTKNKAVLKACEKSIEFLYYFAHPDGSFGGEYGSRNTQYLIPHGIEIMAREFTNAKILANQLRESLKNKTTISPHSLDDRYLTYIAYTWLQAYHESMPINIQKKERVFTKNFQKAKIWIYKDKTRQAIINYGKGGAYQIFVNGKLVSADSGILLETIKGKKMSTSMITNNKTQFTQNKIFIEGYFYLMKKNIMNPSKNIILRLFQMTIGQNQYISRIIKNVLRKKLITKKQTQKAKFRRQFEIKKNKIVIKDKIQSKEKIKKIISGAKYSHIYIPSAEYFQENELNINKFKEHKNDDLDLKREIKNGY